MTSVCLITGASSGLGRAFFKKLSQRHDIDAFWLIARRRERLENLAHTTDRPVRILPLDLTDKESFGILKDTLETEKPDITWCICAAGMGRVDKVVHQSEDDIEAMIDLNCRAAAAVTRLCLPYMHKGARIIEISSIAGFQPMPNFAVYAASKAFLESFAKALHIELIPKGIHVTCVCPYWIKDTEFIAKTDNRKYFRHPILAGRSSVVITLSLAASKINLWMVTPDIISTVQRLVSWIVPEWISAPFMDLISHI